MVPDGEELYVTAVLAVLGVVHSPILNPSRENGNCLLASLFDQLSLQGQPYPEVVRHTVRKRKRRKKWNTYLGRKELSASFPREGGTRVDSSIDSYESDESVEIDNQCAQAVERRERMVSAQQLGLDNFKCDFHPNDAFFLQMFRKYFWFKSDKCSQASTSGQCTPAIQRIVDKLNRGDKL